MNKIKLSNGDYEALQMIYQNATEKMKKELLKLSFWNQIDVVHLEVDMAEKLIDLTLSPPQLAHAGDIIYIKNTAQDIHKDYIGNFYKVSGTDRYSGTERAYLLAKDTLNNNSEYHVTFNDNEYSILILGV